MANSKIEWLKNKDGTQGKVWNPVVGCTHAGSHGCDYCYARELHERRHKAFLSGKKMPRQYAKPFNEIQLMEDRLDIPLRWRKPQMIFVNSMSDLFHEDVSDDFICEVFGRMYFAKQHTFMILTKRPQRMKQFFDNWESPDWPLPNVWLGVTTENQEMADKRIPILLQIPASVRFISAEPLLSSIVLRRKAIDDQEIIQAALMGQLDEYSRPVERGIDWVIAGPETGPKKRPMEFDWIYNLAGQCDGAKVPFFDKKNTLGLNLQQFPEVSP
jgi:protein gp37